MYGINNSEVEMTIVAIGNGTTVSVPVSNESYIENNEYGVFYYTDPQYDVNITSWNTEVLPLTDGYDNIQNELNSLKASGEATDVDGVTVYHNTDTDTYFIETGSNDTHDSLLISCKDRNMLVKVYSTVKFGVSDFSKISNSTNVKIVNNTTNSSRYVVDEYGTYDTENGTYVDGEFAGLTRTQIEQYYYSDSGYYDESGYYYDNSGYYDESGYYYDDSGYYDDGSYYYEYEYYYQ